MTREEGVGEAEAGEGERGGWMMTELKRDKYPSTGIPDDVGVIWRAASVPQRGGRVWSNSY